jgi:hypothetical protein
MVRWCLIYFGYRGLREMIKKGLIIIIHNHYICVSRGSSVVGL